MKTYKIYNNFHNTEATVKTKDGRLNRRQIQRCKHKLCGLSDCCCGGEMGERGPQECEIIDLGYGLGFEYPIKIEEIE